MYHDAITQKDELLTLFNLGYLGLEDRSKGETLFWEVCRKLSRILASKTLKYIPEEFQDLNKSLADKLIANFSIFQSMPDHWAIEQLFPVMPIHRLKEKPGLSATLCDITCDSDGKMENEAHIMVHEDDTFKVQHLVKGDTVDHVLRSVHYDPDVLIQGPQTKRRASVKNDAAEALRTLLTEERNLHTYLEI